MYIDNDDFSVWMQKLYAKLEELCKDVRVLRNADRVLPEDECTIRLPMSGSSSRSGSALPRCASSRKNTARRKRSELESRGGSAPALLLFYGLPNLSASSFSCSACSFNSLARSNASACFLLRYSKPFTELVRLRMKALSRSRLNFVSSKSRLLPSAFPFIRI